MPKYFHLYNLKITHCTLSMRVSRENDAERGIILPNQRPYLVNTIDTSLFSIYKEMSNVKTRHELELLRMGTRLRSNSIPKCEQLHFYTLH